MSETRKKPAQAAPGDLLKIPYDETKAIWGRVIYNDSRGAANKRGLYLAVLDRDVTGSDDLAEVARAPRLLGPLHSGDELVKDGSWAIAGHIEPTAAEQALPYFEDRIGVVDYFFERVADTPENRARMVDEYIVSPGIVTRVVRAARGLGPWSPAYNRYRSKQGS